MFVLERKKPQRIQITCLENTTLEICYAQWWANVRSGTVHLTVNFHGLVPSHPALTAQDPVATGLAG